MWVYWTISIPYEKFHVCDFTQTIWMMFFIQINITMLKKKIIEKINFVWNIKKIMLEAFVSTFILHVYQNVRWNQRKIDPKIIQNLLKTNAFSCLKWTPHKVISPITFTKSSYFSHQIWFLKATLIPQTNSHKI
jgi:hypothetical protein